MRGRITLNIKKRTYSESRRYKDKWNMLDTVAFTSVPPKYYETDSKQTGRRFMITRDELAFVRFLYNTYGPGDYSIMLYGKGKYKGFRRFWDGLITPDGKFLRRKENGHNNESFYSRDSIFTLNTESFIGRFMKTRHPGIWHNL